MSGRERARTALAGSAGMGVLGDLLLRASGPPGLNAVIWSLAGVLLLGGLVIRRNWPAMRESAALIGVAFLFICALAWRDAESLRALNVFTAFAAVLLAAGAAGLGWIRRAGVSDYAHAALRNGLNIAAGPFMLVGALGPRETVPGVAARAWRRHGLAAVRGALLAIPLLFVFGGLLGAADPMFARLLTNTLVFDAELLLSHVLLAGFFAWASAGYLSIYVAPSRLTTLTIPVRQPRIGVVDGTVALGLINALFLAFVLVQVRYLYGGADTIEVTPGLSYADYARRGFFELVAVAGLVIPVLLLADWSVQRTRPRAEWTFRGFCMLQLVLLAAIMVSALHRMRLYQAAYGLTEQRLYATVFMGWIAAVLVWLGITVLRGRRRAFAFGALTAALVAAAALNIANPHALIVRVNAARVAAGHAYDAPYAGMLSADAVPTLLRVLPGLPAADRCVVAPALLQEYMSRAEGDWRTWNFGEWRARRAVARAQRLLASVCAQSAATD